MCALFGHIGCLLCAPIDYAIHLSRLFNYLLDCFWSMLRWDVQADIIDNAAAQEETREAREQYSENARLSCQVCTLFPYFSCVHASASTKRRTAQTWDMCLLYSSSNQNIIYTDFRLSSVSICKVWLFRFPTAWRIWWRSPCGCVTGELGNQVHVSDLAADEDSFFVAGADKLKEYRWNNKSNKDRHPFFFFFPLLTKNLWILFAVMKTKTSSKGWTTEKKGTRIFRYLKFLAAHQIQVHSIRPQPHRLGSSSWFNCCETAPSLKTYFLVPFQKSWSFQVYHFPAEHTRKRLIWCCMYEVHCCHGEGGGGEGGALWKEH